MIFQLNCLKSNLRLFIISIAVVAVTRAMEVENGEYVKPSIFIRKLTPRTRLQPEIAINHSGMYFLWHKLLVRVTADLKQSVLAKSFGVMEVPIEQEWSPMSAELLKLTNIAGGVELENRIICAMLVLMKILLALDIIILAGVLIMLLNCFVTTKVPAEDEVIKV